MGREPRRADWRSGFAGGLTSLRRSVLLWALSLLATLVSLLVSVTVTLLGIGLGVLMVPWTVGLVRRLANRQRALAGQESGDPIPVPYAPPPRPAPGVRGVLVRCRWIVQDRQTWRDWLWVTLDPVVGGALAFAPLALVLSGLWGIGIGFWGVPLSHAWDNLWYTFVPIQGQATATLAGVLGLAQLPLAVWIAPRVVRVHARYTRALLAPSQQARMAHRIEHLAATRADAVDTGTAELRRIERDLHDGAQARLVAMGMTLDAAEHLMESDPAAGRALLAEAKDSSVKAIQELRDLVRGIHPPVLADRGLADAIRALALVSPLETEVVVDLPGRPEPPLESAAYFAVSEILTNAVKHSGGDRVWIDLRYDPDVHALRITVTDDGHGGLRMSPGGGLCGVERRLATFDGVLAVQSPVNGPTMVSLELPCELSSPKTSSS